MGLLSAASTMGGVGLYIGSNKTAEHRHDESLGPRKVTTGIEGDDYGEGQNEMVTDGLSPSEITTGGSESGVDALDLKHAKRKANTEAARRSRMRKRQTLEMYESQCQKLDMLVSQLQNENQALLLQNQELRLTLLRQAPT